MNLKTGAQSLDSECSACMYMRRWLTIFTEESAPSWKTTRAIVGAPSLRVPLCHHAYFHTSKPYLQPVLQQLPSSSHKPRYISPVPPALMANVQKPFMPSSRGPIPSRSAHSIKRRVGLVVATSDQAPPPLPRYALTLGSIIPSRVADAVINASPRARVRLSLRVAAGRLQD